MSFELILPFLRPLEGLLLDPEISEIMGNPDGSFWYEREGTIRRASEITFSPSALHAALEVIANKLGKKLDADSPLLNTRLPDGSRLAAMIPPLVHPSPAVTIRKFNSRNFTAEDLVARGTCGKDLLDRIGQHVHQGDNILISGGTGAGKTTLVNILASYIPDDERIVIIEDTAELNFRKPQLVAAESQTDTHKANVTYDDLVRAALRHRPDRLILGEVRGPEARSLLDAWNTGHCGSLSTIHANSASAALRRLANLAMRGAPQLTQQEIETEIAESLQLVVQIVRAPEGRVIQEVIEINGYDPDARRFLTVVLYRNS